MVLHLDVLLALHVGTEDANQLLVDDGPTNAEDRVLKQRCRRLHHITQPCVLDVNGVARYYYRDLDPIHSQTSAHHINDDRTQRKGDNTSHSEL